LQRVPTSPYLAEVIATIRALKLNPENVAGRHAP
jgi:hypothetical protein